jgi:ribosomal protein L3 glutamine methyltransferase
VNFVQDKHAVARRGGRIPRPFTDQANIIHRIIESAANYLNERGALVLEIGNEYEHFHQAFAHIPTIWLEVSAGDMQVCLIQAEDLQNN